MADIKISGLATSAISIGGYIPIVIGGVTKKVLVASVFDYISTDDGNGGQPPAPKVTATRTGDGTLVVPAELISGKGQLVLVKSWSSATGHGNTELFLITGDGVTPYMVATSLGRSGPVTYPTYVWSATSTVLTLTVSNSGGSIVYVTVLGNY